MNKYLKYFSGTLVGLMLSTSAFAAAEYAVVLQTLSNPFWVDMKKGIEDEAKTLGVSVDIFASPSEGDFQSLKHTEPSQLLPLVLAYIGDSIYDLVIKTWVIEQGNMQVNKLNKKTSSIVKAESQSAMIGVIEPMLSEHEEAV